VAVAVPELVERVEIEDRWASEQGDNVSPACPKPLHANERRRRGGGGEKRGLTDEDRGPLRDGYRSHRLAVSRISDGLREREEVVLACDPDRRRHRRVEAHRLTDDGIEVGQGVELVPARQDGVSASVEREWVRSTGAKLATTHMLGSSVGHAISSARSLSWIAVFSHSA